MIADAIVAEHQAWLKYRGYCRTMCSPYYEGVTGFCGDATSHGLWNVWRSAYEARRDAAKPFYRRTNGIRFGR